MGARDEVPGRGADLLRRGADRACRDDDEIAVLGLGEPDQRLLGRSDDELGADRGARLARGLGLGLRVELGAVALEIGLGVIRVGDVHEDHLAIATGRGEGTRDVERAAARVGQVSTANDRHD